MTISQLCRPPAGTILTRAATLQPASFDPTDNSVEVIWTTGATIRRSDWIDGDYDETLATNPENVRLERLNAGGPVLANHNRSDLSAIVGSVVSGTARMANGQGVARIRLADTPDVADIVAKVVGGHIRSVSAGYIIHAYEVREGDQRREILVVDWEPVEISLVPIPADQGSFIRSKETTMSAPSLQGPVTARNITTAAMNAGLGAAAIDALMERHEHAPFTQQSLMSEIGKGFAMRDTVAPISSRSPSYESSMSGAHFLRSRMSDALMARMGGTPPTDAGREFMGTSLANMARALLEASGERVQWQSDAQVVDRAMHSTSDFSTLLTMTGNRFLLETFATAESGIKAVARERSANDFRDLTIAKLSNAPWLEKVNENGEVTYGTFSDGKESYKLATFAKIFGISRQSLINDDLGAFADPLRLMARAAAETEAQELAALLTANGGAGVTMGDGNPLYHASHGNKAAANAAISIASLGTARQAMRDQKDLDGKTPVNSVPKILLVGTATETIAEQILTQTSAVVASESNPFPNKLSLAVDPRLAGLSWRLFADPTLFPVIEYAYLSSARGPQLATRDGWNSMGSEFRVHLDFGCGAVDHRGSYLNGGA